jgi:hypothetical protein
LKILSGIRDVNKSEIWQQIKQQNFDFFFRRIHQDYVRKQTHLIIAKYNIYFEWRYYFLVGNSSTRYSILIKRLVKSVFPVAISGAINWHDFGAIFYCTDLINSGGGGELSRCSIWVKQVVYFSVRLNYCNLKISVHMHHALGKIL